MRIKTKMNIKIILLLTAILQLNNNMQIKDKPFLNRQYRPVLLFIEMTNFMLKIAAITKETMNKNYSSITQKNRNKIMHALKGNRAATSNLIQKDKNVKNIKETTHNNNATFLTQHTTAAISKESTYKNYNTPTKENKTAAISKESTTKNYASSKQSENNKIMHSANGNRAAKIRSHLKIQQINKGHSNFSTKLNNILSLIEKEKPDILTISEANIEVDHPSLMNNLSGYNAELKILGNAKQARLLVLVKSGITYERVEKFENDINAMITLKIKTSSRGSLYLVCVYRQWKLLHTDDQLSNLPGLS